LFNNEEEKEGAPAKGFMGFGAANLKRRLAVRLPRELSLSQQRPPICVWVLIEEVPHHPPTEPAYTIRPE
jgi:hypothetical protein